MSDHQNLLNSVSSLGKSILPKGSALWLYGSHARGSASADSDWDLLILLNKEKQEIEDFDRYSYPFIDLGATLGEIISAQIYTVKEWQSLSFTPFVKNVERDKQVLLWD